MCAQFRYAVTGNEEEWKAAVSRALVATNIKKKKRFGANTADGGTLRKKNTLKRRSTSTNTSHYSHTLQYIIICIYIGTLNFT